MQTLWKHPDSARQFEFEFDDYEEIEAGQLLTTTNLAVAQEDGDGLLTIATPSLAADSKSVVVMLSAGTHAVEYDLKCTAQTNAATTPATKLIGKGKLIVDKDQPQV